MRAMTWIGAGLAGAALAIAAWAAMIAMRPAVPGDMGALGELRKLKLAAAARAEGPRILVMAGSSAYYGVGTAQMARATGVPSFNLAMMGGLGLEYMADMVAAAARPGDLLLLPLEYELYQEAEAPAPTEASFALAADPGYLRRLPPERALRVALAFDFLGAMRALPADLRRDRSQDRGSALAGMGPTGDTAWTARADRRGIDVALARSYHPAHTFLTPTLAAPARRRLTNLVAWCRAHGVAPVAAFPNMVELPAEVAGQPMIEPAMRAFFGGLGVPVVGAPARAHFPPGEAFDTPHHPTAEYRVIRTRKLLEDLAPVLAAWRREAQAVTPPGDPRVARR